MAERNGLFKVDAAGRLMMYSPRHKRYLYFEEWHIYEKRFAEKRLPRAREFIRKVKSAITAGLSGFME